jgi:hypothetical protein
MPLAGPFYFHWIDTPDPVALANNTAFNPSTMDTMDEYIFSFKLTLKEGDKPTLDLVIRNPHIGLLNSSRKQWAWFSRLDSTGHIRPLFCGRLVAAPKDVFKEQMAIQLVAWPIDYFEQLQAQAETIKNSGPYDPVFIDVTKRDDPDTVLEAVSALYHVDPVTHLVTVSDIVNGEDGNVVITQDEHLYDAMEVDFDQTTQITQTLMIADVSWNQTGQGYIPMTPQLIRTYSGDSVIGDWPKPLSSLGAGYTVAFSNAFDSAGIAAAVTASASYSWTNKDKQHADGDSMSLNWSMSAPSIDPSLSAAVAILVQNTPGFLDPFAVDADGDPSPVNQPMKLNVTFAQAGVWQVNTTLTLLYRDLQRTRTERLQMMLTSDLQPILVDPLVTQDAEVITKQGADVSQPILNLLNWSTVAGQHVNTETIVFPDDPSLPSQRTAQICVVAGTAGTVEPDFSDVPGTITVDGTVHWASVGTPNPPETAYDWTAVSNVPAGEIILPRKPLFITYAALILPGQQTVPQTSVQVSRGQIVQFPDGNYYVCTTPGLVGVQGQSAVFTLIGPSLPDGKTHYIAVQSGRTGPEFIIPQFNPTLHAQTTDGTVIWAAVGTGDLPIGGTPGDTWGRTYFDTARGLQSVEYLISILRARGLMKARAVTVNFTPIDPFGLGASLTCRKDATVYDTRLAGGFAVGKVVSVEFSCDGSNGQEACHAQIGCCIGKDNVISGSAGTPVYVNGYVQGYQQYISNVVLVGDNSDVGYTPPKVIPNDDGLVFPLSYGQVVISEAVLGSISSQAGAIGRVYAAMQLSALLGIFQSDSPSINYSLALAKQQQLLSAYTINWATSVNPVWYDLVLKPLSGLQFNNNCVVTLTNLTAPKGIDLTGASTP